MKLYAELPQRRAWQMVADVTVLGWLLLWLQLGAAAHDSIDAFVDPGRRVEDAGRDVAVVAADAGRQLDDLPLVGAQLAVPFDAIADAARDVAAAGEAQQEATARLADRVGAAVALVPIMAVTLLWLWWRVGWAKQASAAVRLRDRPEAVPLLAARAIAHLPLTHLDRVVSQHPETLTGRAAQEQLAAVQLRQLGLRPGRR